MTGQTPEAAKIDRPTGTAQPKTLAEIIRSIFSISLDKDQNIKPASLPKSVYKAIASGQFKNGLQSELADSLSLDASKTDAQLHTLAQLMVAGCKCREDKPRTDLIVFCVRLASNLWINHHWDTHNLYKQILDNQQGLDTTPQNHLKNVISSLYDKRIEATQKKVLLAVSDDADKNGKSELINTLSANELQAQRDNIQLIGSLWLMTQATETQQHDQNISFLIDLLDKRKSKSPSTRDITIELAQRFVEKDTIFADTLAHIQKHGNEQAARGIRLAAALEHSNQEVSRLQRLLDEAISSAHEAARRAEERDAEIRRLETTLDELQLDERAKRTHLRDNTGQVKAKAFNLLTEDVVEPLKLSLSALQRENPKTAVAIHHIELAMESIERDIKWFKE